MYIDQIPLIVGSGDRLAFPGSTNSDFTVPLVDALVLKGRWQIHVTDISFANPNATQNQAAKTNNSVIVRLPGIVRSSIVGSALMPIVFKTGPLVPTNTQRYMYVRVVDANPVWYDIEPSVINNFRVQVTQIDGTLLPPTDDLLDINFTTVSFILRKVADE